MFRDAASVAWVAAFIEQRQQADKPAVDAIALAARAALQPTSETALIRINAAKAALQRLQTGPSLSVDQCARYRRADVQKSFPSPEGRGRGRKADAGAHRSRIIALGTYMLTNAPLSQVQHLPQTRRARIETATPLAALFEWCESNGITRKRDQFAPLRRKALVWAEEELAARVRSGVGFKEPGLPAKAEWEFAAANLAAWKSLGKPTPPPACIL